MKETKLFKMFMWLLVLGVSWTLAIPEGTVMASEQKHSFRSSVAPKPGKPPEEKKKTSAAKSSSKSGKKKADKAPQKAPKAAQTPKTSQKNAKTVQKAPKASQKDAKITQKHPNTSKKGPKAAQKGSEVPRQESKATKTPQKDTQSVQKNSKVSKKDTQPAQRKLKAAKQEPKAAKTPGKDSKTVQKANPAGSGNSQETRTPKGSKTAATGKKLSQADAKGITGKVDRKALKKPITTQRLKKKKASAAKIHSKKTNKDLHLNVKAAFLVNMSNEKIYYEQNPDTPIAPASITTEDRYRTSE